MALASPRWLLPVLLLASARVAADPLPVAPPGASAACPADGPAVAVATRDRVLRLCEMGRTVAEFRIALGHGGVDKRRKGDARTPLGVYSLGEPRSSRRFGTFIPIGYPTAAQAAGGYTGGDVGIHGPHRLTAGTWLAVRFDWTEGCIATGSDEDLARIVAFVQQRSPAVVIY